MQFVEDHGDYELLLNRGGVYVIACPVCGRVVVLGGDVGRAIVCKGNQWAHHNSFVLGDWRISTPKIERVEPNDYAALFPPLDAE